MILIVDDQMDSGPTLAQMLRRCGHDSIAVTSGPAALSLLAKLTPSVVVLDACVPDVPELDTLRRIRSDPALQLLPVIVYSPDADPRAVDRAVRLGAQDYLVKGHTPLDEVCLTVARYVNA